MGQYGPEALLDAAGNALSGATVTVAQAGYAASVDTRGNLTITGRPGSVDFTVTPSGGVAQQPISAVVLPGPGEVSLRSAGLYLPPGSLDRWRAARDLSGSTRCEVAIFGDSTSAGAPDSWVPWLRKRSTLAGFVDGGRGMTPATDNANLSSPDDYLTSVVSNTGWTTPGSGMMGGNCWTSATVGAAITLRSRGTRFKVWSLRAQGPDISYTVSVDGGAPVTVTVPTTGGQDSKGLHVYEQTGLPEALREITITLVAGTNNFTLESLRNAGIVWNNHSRGGVTTTSYFSSGASTVTQLNALYPMGASYVFNAAHFRAGKDPAPTAHSPKLSIFALGYNNANAAGAEPGATGYQDALQFWLSLCENVGADPLLVVAQFGAGSDTVARDTGPAFRRTAYQMAEAYGCALVDFDTILGPRNTRVSRGVQSAVTDVHLTTLGCQVQADFLWDNVLSK